MDRIWKPITLVLLIFAVIMSSCMDDNDWNGLNFTKARSGARGVFIVNEGNSWSDNASLSYYNTDSGYVENLIIYRNNDRLGLGDLAQSMVIHDTLGYVVISNSGKIYSIDLNTFKVVDKITGLIAPRYIHFISDTRAYVTDMYSKAITIINPQTYTITGSIDVSNHASQFYQHATEQMVQYDKYVFTNCWSYDNKILVIDTETDMLVDSIEVGVQPTSLVIDRYDRIWTITDGGFEGNKFGYEPPKLYKIDAETRQIEKVWTFDLEENASNLAINGSGDTIFFIKSHVYRLPVLSDQEPEKIIQSPYSPNYYGGYYGLDIDPYNSDIYVADAADNSRVGTIYRYNANLTPADTFQVGILPSEFCFQINN